MRLPPDRILFVSQINVEPFAELPLHDATLQTLQVAWSASEVVAELIPVQAGRWAGQRMRLTWSECTRLSAPHESPWGSSDAVNAHGHEGRRFWLELQSGDLVEVWASEVRVDRLAN